MTKINAEGTARDGNNRNMTLFFQLKTLSVENKKVIFDLEVSLKKNV
jgi:hypothetical protein